ncbi:hypothetical protein BKA04_002083 [Cryobacterium mesophilum]|uniref:Uncharacterized protein n=1 Tax=Terrimesophilobacter mesophilus TaxID=433647 RepID=A0A4R8VFC5_9MICO|nr:hypothetical protein [Terrimesophilobacter mesophilus]MBB5633860.1 hypothetical protein [Terrimesophilobacter mesophilus]TFB80537.1 hypothetical protein E3N84_11120 [Terrimesophilobacter mesophilus]
MLKKLIVTGAASVLGVVLVAGGAWAATGSLTVSDAPGQVLKVDGVGPASTHASETATMHANANAKGLFGTNTDATVEGEQDGTTDSVTPVAPQDASKDASTVKGSMTGQEISAWAHEQAGVEVVTPGGAISVQGEAHAKNQ